ncbi:endolytic transglycosylase MltG [Enterococcus avium]|nr:endolytic transglycosylase MltG [Enterococcus avium]MDO7799166.1 endolytic transglycosylase MltG [Enterococcus avium]
MSEDQNQHSEEGSFKEQIMRALEEGRKNREVEPTKKASSISAGPSTGPSKTKKDTSDDDDLTSSYERLFGNRQKKESTAAERKSEPIEEEIKKEEPLKKEKESEKKVHLDDSEAKSKIRKERKKSTAEKTSPIKKEQTKEPSVIQEKKAESRRDESKRAAKTVPSKKKEKAEGIKQSKHDEHVEEEPSIFQRIGEKFDDLRNMDEDFEGDLSEESNLKRAERRKEDRVVRKIVYILTIGILIVAGILAISGYNYVSAGLKPLDKNDKKLVQVEVPSGSSNRQIGDILEEGEVIRDGMVFNFYTKFKNLTNFQAGYYQFSPNMTLDQISKELQQGGSAEPLDDASKLTIPEGYDVDKIASLVAKKTDFKKEDFIKVMKDDKFFEQLKTQYPDLLTDAGNAKDVRYRLEGYLFPATYNVHKNRSLEDLVTQMVDTTNQILTPYYSQIKEKGLNVQEVMTLASLVEKEGVTQSDRKKIAQVFFNRIEAQMPLQSDISILYALGEHKEVVTIKDTEVDSPYNLYTNTGYGPGPFDNPSQEAILAVLDPTENDYIYFVADISTGKVYYAKTYEEHMELVEKYVNKEK